METISENYLLQQKQLHLNPRYGVASLGYAPLVEDILQVTGYKSICDYGAGKCRLGVALKGKIKQLQYHPFDPAFPEYGVATASQLVTCIDVLEHIEPDYLDQVISELAQLTTHLALLTVHTGPAHKTLADGRNAHLIQQPASWWLDKLLRYFDVVELRPVKNGFWVLVQHKGSDHSKIFARKPDKATLAGKLTRIIHRIFQS
jgi:hypothetical protein